MGQGDTLDVGRLADHQSHDLRQGISQLRRQPQHDFEVSIMTDALNGFYAAYLSGKAGQGFAMLVFRNGKIVGAGPLGESFDGQYTDAGGDMLTVSVTTKAPANVALIQGGMTGPDGEIYTSNFQIPNNFSSQNFIRIETHRGPINVKLVKIRNLND
ncbi:MAG TPA: hypothetical protein VN715_23250 [Roseiarcus sp.]|nr:hypothetical protein [Roseiarcus sp.]